MKKTEREKKNLKKSFTGFALLILSFAIPSFYNACSPNHSSGGEEFLSSLGDDPCGLSADFQKTFYPFLATQCASCHVTGGQGKGRFADSNPGFAWETFSQMGHERIAAMAVNPVHKPPYTGPNNKGVVERIQKDWLSAVQQKSSCKAGTGISDVFLENEWHQLKSRPVGAIEIGDSKTVTWDLGKDFLPSELERPSLTGAKISMKIQVSEILDKAYYQVSEPRLILKDAAKDLSLEGLKVKINGAWINDQTTFKGIKVQVRRGEDQMISAGLLNYTDRVNRSDVISLGFFKLDETDLPPPPAEANVFFRVSEVSAPTESGVYSLFVEMDRAVEGNTVTVQISASDGSDGGAAHQLRDDGMTILDEEFEEVQVRNFNWDYEIEQYYTQNFSVKFASGEISKEVKIRLNNDDRPEPVETFQLKIESVSGAKFDAARSDFQFTIPDDQDLATGRTTLTELLSPAGYLGQRCLKCHNSQVANQNNDLTDYARLISPSNLLATPYMPDQSEIYLRTQTEDLLRKMPCATIDGQCVGSEGLPDLGAAKLRDWIEAGAKND